MRRLSIMAFDDFIPNTTAVYTSQELNAKLGKFDTLAWHAVIDNITGTGSMTVTLEHSGDDRTFRAKSNHGTGGGGASAPESTFSISAGFVQGTGYDSNVFGGVQLPSLPFVRLKLQLLTVTSAHLRLWVTARDRGHPAKPMNLKLGHHA